MDENEADNVPTPEVESMDTDDEMLDSAPDSPMSTLGPVHMGSTPPRNRGRGGRRGLTLDPHDIDEQPVVKKPVIVENPTIDLEAYISNFSGRGKIDRLMFIASHAPSLAIDSLKMAEEETRNSTISTSLYGEVHNRLVTECSSKKATMPPNIPNTAWTEETDRKAAIMLESLNKELNQNRTKALKQYIVIGQTDLGDFYFNRGDWPNALKSYLRTRDYSCNNEHLIQMCENVMKTYTQMNNWSSVLTYASKAEAIPEFAANATKSSRAKVLCALAHLSNRQYNKVAEILCACPLEAVSNWTTTVSLTDIGTYGGVCALATLDRTSLRKTVLENVEFKNFLENVPVIRELIKDFYHSRYASCFRSLDSIKADLLLDMYLSPHVEELYNKIRRKALVQYFVPLISKDLTRMAESFNTDLPGLTAELASLIIDNEIDARIDSHRKVLQANNVNIRNTAFQKSLDLSETYQRRVRGMLLHVAMEKEGFCVRASKSSTARSMGSVEDREGRGRSRGKGKERAMEAS